jgi:predicted transposase YbfD/YdcC
LHHQNPGSNTFFAAPGPLAPGGKSNEITAIPELLGKLAIKGAIIFIDAMRTQKAIAAKIVEREADYVLALKGNQSVLMTTVKGSLKIRS